MTRPGKRKDPRRKAGIEPGSAALEAGALTTRQDRLWLGLLEVQVVDSEDVLLHAQGGPADVEDVLHAGRVVWRHQPVHILQETATGQCMCKLYVRERGGGGGEGLVEGKTRRERERERVGGMSCTLGV